MLQTDLSKQNLTRKQKFINIQRTSVPLREFSLKPFREITSPPYLTKTYYNGNFPRFWFHCITQPT